MVLVEFTNEIKNQEQFNVVALKAARCLRLYKKTRNAMYYNELNCLLSLIREVGYKNNYLNDERDNTADNLFSNQGYHGSQKNETHEEYWSESVNG